MKKVLKLMICFCLIIPCCGCLPTTQLEERAIVQAAAVDYSEEEYRLTLQIFDAGSGAENAGGSEAYLVWESSGTTLTQAFAQAAQNGKEIYLGSCQILAVGQGSRDQLLTILEYFNSRPQTRATMMVVCADGSAAELLKIAQGKCKPTPADAAEQELKLAEENKRLLPCRLKDILAAMETEGRDGILPLMATTGQEEKARLSLMGSVVFCGGVPAVELTVQETAVLGWSLWGQGNILLNIDSVPTVQGSTPILLEHFSPRLSAELEDGLPCLNFTLKTKGRISEGVGNGTDQPDPKQLATLQTAAAAQMAAQLQDLLAKLCAVGSDPLRFGERLQRSHPSEWNSTKENWSDLLTQAKLNITVQCELTAFSGKKA
ncbi:MAG: Ger(x)C family spore germination protein [Oscillospiraceae bacterium]|nr:Ger(x)C family spore germination protein [Oscillospiraceae bacterium]